MRWLIKLIVIAAIGWSGYWFIGARGQEQLLAVWLENNREAGWTAETKTMGVTGFPNRFDTIITGLNLQDPESGWGWVAEEFQIFALSYKPNHLIMAWPGLQTITTPEGNVTIEGSQMRGSVELGASTNLPLERLRFEGSEIVVSTDMGWDGTILGANIALFQVEGEPQRYRLGVDMAEISIPQKYMPLIVQLGQNSNLISRILASIYVDFDQQIDRNALTDGLPTWRNMDVDSVSVTWGRASLTITGSLTPADNGYIDGHLDFHVENWRMLFAAFRQMSNLRLSELASVETALNRVAQGTNLDFTLRFENGKTLIGPMTIGPALINPFF
ncbi:MAG: DUF2125 domain-containing protein [Rhodobacteraceae bacterium]|nr:DUF2125 domain-containing protein [Paracoccaceae bacterium]